MQKGEAPWDTIADVQVGGLFSLRKAAPVAPELDLLSLSTALVLFATTCIKPLTPPNIKYFQYTVMYHNGEHLILGGGEVYRQAEEVAGSECSRTSGNV